MGRNNSSLKHQLHTNLMDQRRFGESKHLAKMEYRTFQESIFEPFNPSKADGIFSFNTYESYEQTSKEFYNWTRLEHPEIRNLNDIDRFLIGEYLLMRDEAGKSADTVSKDMAALNKIFNYGITKREFGLTRRSYKTITRSRLDRPHDKEVKLSNYQNEIIFAKGTGCRRESILRVKPSDLLRNTAGTVIAVNLTEKGGRPRTAIILKEYQSQITAYADERPSDAPLFESYPHRIDNHAYRGEYALNRYMEALDAKGGIITNNYRGYDLSSILQVSKDLGHNRPAVVVEHYLPRKGIS